MRFNFELDLIFETYSNISEKKYKIIIKNYIVNET
jgi:hypothetical protein